MSVASVTSDRSYLQIVKNNNTLVGATSHGGDTDGTFPNSTTAHGSTVFDFSGSSTITHSVGSVPFVRAFYDADKNGILYNTIRWTSGGNLASVLASPNLLTLNSSTTTKLIITSGSSVSNIPVYYRIYRFGTYGFTSDAPVDKIFLNSTTSKTLGAAVDSTTPVLATDTIAHGQGEKIFWALQFSLDQNTWYKEGSIVFGAADTGSGPPGGPYSRYYYTTAYGSTDATNLYVTYINCNTTQQTIYIRYVLDYIGAVV